MIGFISISFGIFYFFYIIHRVQKRKFPERESIIWLFFGLIILALSIFPQVLIWSATLIGISYPPTLLFLLSILALTFILIRKEEKISDLQTKINELAKRVALLEHHHKKKS